MAAEIKETFGQGGANLTPSGQGEPTLAEALGSAGDDLAELRTQFVALLAKLDAEDVTNMDTDYASLLTPAAQTLTRDPNWT